ncbi:Nuclear intron maturase 3, mitochondrial [Sesamum alatum]|uniref:Nuclear intron maturase 3, mitochondrial n=1 Tax=Sesamum alatum TaxID=300844 RepID=A0AAE2CRR5_9LAMI|nr:Nuclear intron maturase 3, mitochondrial [Sesamum alatum]
MLLSFLRKPKSATISAVNLRLSGRNLAVLSPPSAPATPFLYGSPTSYKISPSNPGFLSHYHHGKFRSLLQHVRRFTLSSSPLATTLEKHAPDSPPPPLTIDWVSAHFFSLQELSFQLSESSLDVESCCVPVFPEAGRGTPLVLPNLKLKVVVEAIRIVLEVIYDDRFATFSYGGAQTWADTAVRYLKNSVEIPVGGKLLLILVGFCLVEGLRKNVHLSSILINIYLNGFDKEVQELRLKTNKENPEFKENELVPGESSSVNVFYKPLKIYAVRYLDEILIITSGTKMLTIDLKNRVVMFMEQNLDLKVDRRRTVIHSAVSEKIDFMGMELQGCCTSVSASANDREGN